MIYFDNAATSLLKPPAVAKAVFDAISQLGNSDRGVHEASLSSGRIVYETREMLAELFRYPHPEQVVFTANSTEALNLAIKGIFVRGDHVITTALEHNSVLRPLYEMEEQGVAVSIVPCDTEGCIRYEALEEVIRKNTTAIICTHVSNLTGNLLDIARIGAICKKHKLKFILDASQSAGVFPIDMEKDKIDVVCFTGHKSLFGPQGTGGLCVRKEVAIKTWKSGGSGIETFARKHPQVMPTRLEAGTLNAHGIAGLHAGLCYIREKGMTAIRAEQTALMWRFYEGVRTLPQVKIYGDFTASDRAAIVSLNIGNEDSGQVSDALRLHYDICTRSGGHCAPLLHQALGTVEQGAVRFSFSHFNTEAQIDAAIHAVKELAEE